MISAIFITWSAAALLLTVNALRRPTPPGRGLPPLWLPGMVVSELAPWILIYRTVVVALFILGGVLERTGGWIGLGLSVLANAGLIVLMARSWRAAVEAGTRPSLLDLWKVTIEIPDGVDVKEAVPYDSASTLDIYSRSGLSGAPALIYLHPGSWMRGKPGRQARPLLYGLAERGWVVLDIRYPLSPSATFPEHLHGVKRAIAWAKTSGIDLGIDTGLVAIAGSSAGAHLAALAALTTDPSLQPGFENKDTSVIACVPHYGIFDLLVRNRTRHDWPFVARHVMKTTPESDRRMYELGSPIDQVRADAPPFMVIHGEYDSVVLPAESEHFAAALSEVGGDVVYHEVFGAQHGFDALPALRARAVGSFVIRHLEDVVAARSIDRDRPRDH